MHIIRGCLISKTELEEKCINLLDFLEKATRNNLYYQQKNSENYIIGLHIGEIPKNATMLIPIIDDSDLIQKIESCGIECVSLRTWIQS